MSKLGGQGTGSQVDRMPGAEMPAQLRESDPNLRYLPLVRLTFGRYVVMIGDYNLVVSCVMPYEGWTAYKATIQRILSTLEDAWFISEIERHSMKYVDLLENEDLSEQVKSVAVDLKIGKYELKKENFQVRIEIPEGSHTKVLQLLTGSVLVDNLPRTGAVVDVDVIKILSTPLRNYLEESSLLLDDLHRINKESFFSCITEETLNSLGPVYE